MPMNGPHNIAVTENSDTPDNKACSITSIIPTLGMSSCRGRAEAFARSLSSKLRTLGTQSEDDIASPEEEIKINESNAANTWMTSNDAEQSVTDLQPLRQESDSYFDFDCDLESPGSPVDECEYLRLIETASNTPHNSVAESGYICASTSSSRGSTDVPYYEHSHEQEASAATGYATVLHNGFNTDDNTSEIHDDTIAVENRCFDCIEDVPNAPTILHTNTAEEAPQQQPEMDEEADLTAIQDKILNELQEQSAHIGTIIEAKHAETTNVANPLSEVKTPSISNGETENTTITNDNDESVIEPPHQEPSESTNKEQTARKELQTALEADEPERTTCQQDTSDQPETNVKDEKSGFAGNDEDEDDCRPQRVRRCSSLKTGKTPPGTPGRKKIVRFADVLGLDLADIKTFLDEIPTIPRSAFEDLEVSETEPPLQLGPTSDRLLMPLFQQPGGLPNFLDLVRKKQVSLENAAVTDHVNQTITGTVRVRNLDFNKSVHIRYTLDNWRSYADLQANYAENSCDGFSDKFAFLLFGNTLQIGQRIEFAVRFQCKGQQFWDNNYGTNYCFQCLPSSTLTAKHTQPMHLEQTHGNPTELLSPTVGDTWCNTFY